MHSKTIAENFHQHWHGKLEDDKLDAVINKLESMTDETAYPATGEVVSMIFYLKFRVNITDGKEFDGNAGGASTPGGGALFGDVYTDDIDKLYADTVTFEFNATSVYLSILFFDSDSELLGHFECGALSTVNGVGGGSGSWS